MFKVLFADCTEVHVHGSATVHDLAELAMEHGKIITMTKVREPRAFPVGWAVIDTGSDAEFA